MNNIKILFFIFFAFLYLTAYNQDNKNIYNPNANAGEDISFAIKTAKEQNKHVFIQIGGNWCPWCLKLHEFYQNDIQIDSVMKADFVTVLVNYSRENKNLDVMQTLQFPQRFGFPVIVILNQDGSLIHTQNSAYLEEGKGYNKKLFMDFLKSWNVDAINPENYK